MENVKVGFAVCGSFCTFDKMLDALRSVAARFGNVLPIFSEAAASIDTRFGSAAGFLREAERICGRPAVTTIAGAEPIGPQKLLDVLIVAPCTGNTLAKLAAGVTDSSVTMACKAQLRNGRPVVLAVSTNDALSANAPNLGALLNRRNCFFVPFMQDDPQGKPCSVVADFGLVADAAAAALAGVQLQPLLRMK